MTLLEWTFLLGVVAVAGPVLAHLLARPRFNRLPFTMLQFLRNSQTESHSRRRLRDLLILMLRCMIVVLIALLFTRPILYVKPEPKGIRHFHYLGLDNSTSMSYTDDLGSYFERMKDSAIKYIVSAEPDAVFNICSLVSGSWTNGLTKQQALAKVKVLRIMAGSPDIDAFLSDIGDDSRNINQGDEVSVLLISDFTPNILRQFLSIQEPTLVDNFRYETIVSSEPINNASLVNAQTLDVTSGDLKISVTVANHGQTKQNRRLTVKSGTHTSTSLTVELQPDQVKTYPVHLDIDLKNAEKRFFPVELNLSSGDCLEDDDRYFLAVRLPDKKKINVLLTEVNEDEMFLLETAIQTLSGRDSAGIIRIRRIGIDDLNSSDIDWADVCICSAITDRLGYMAKDLISFVEAGGRAVFFMTGEPNTGAVNQLWQLGVLPALPKKLVQEQTYPEISPLEKQFFGVEGSSATAIAAKAMSNYRIDRIPLAGFWECKSHTKSQCLWRYQNEYGFIYCKQIGSGTSFLVNTSADGSLGSLTKSSVLVPLCQYLLGEYNHVRDLSFTCDQRVVLPAADVVTEHARQKQIFVQSCDGTRRQAVIAESSILLPDPGGVGWIKTLTEPAIYAGINLPADETNLSKPVIDEVDNALERVFSVGKRKAVASADSFNTREQKPVWKTLVWIIIILLLIESALANRLWR